MKKRNRINVAVSFLVVFFLLCGCTDKPVVTISTVDEETVSEQEESLKEIPNDNGKQETNRLLIHICGAVSNPGVYELAEGERICHAIEQAGGFTRQADENYLNQAQKLTDGMRIYIPTKEETSQIPKDNLLQSQELRQVSESERININTATIAQLCSLPGIGEGKAQSIITYREEKGKFSSIEEIMNVEGIKEGLFEKIRDSITVS